MADSGHMVPMSSNNRFRPLSIFDLSITRKLDLSELLPAQPPIRQVFLSFCMFIPPHCMRVFSSFVARHAMPVVPSLALLRKPLSSSHPLSPQKKPSKCILYT